MRDFPRRSQGERPSVLLLDGCSDFALLVEGFLRRQRDLEMLEILCLGEDPVSKAADLRRCVVVVDLEEPGVDSLALINRLRRALPDLPIVALSLSKDSAHRQAAVQAGADVLVYKAHLVQDLMPAIYQARHPERIN